MGGKIFHTIFCLLSFLKRKRRKRKSNLFLNTTVRTEKKVTTENGEIITEEYPVLVSGKPIVLSEIYPEICGVIIIAKGASDIKVKVALMCAAQTFLDIESDKIEILTMR